MAVNDRLLRILNRIISNAEKGGGQGLTRQMVDVIASYGASLDSASYNELKTSLGHMSGNQTVVNHLTQTMEKHRKKFGGGTGPSIEQERLLSSVSSLASFNKDLTAGKISEQDASTLSQDLSNLQALSSVSYAFTPQEKKFLTGYKQLASESIYRQSLSSVQSLSEHRLSPSVGMGGLTPSTLESYQRQYKDFQSSKSGILKRAQNIAPSHYRELEARLRSREQAMRSRFVSNIGKHISSAAGEFKVGEQGELIPISPSDRKAFAEQAEQFRTQAAELGLDPQTQKALGGVINPAISSARLAAFREQRKQQRAEEMWGTRSGVIHATRRMEFGPDGVRELSAADRASNIRQELQWVTGLAEGETDPTKRLELSQQRQRLGTEYLKATKEVSAGALGDIRSQLKTAASKEGTFAERRERLKSFQSDAERQLGRYDESTNEKIVDAINRSNDLLRSIDVEQKRTSETERKERMKEARQREQNNRFYRSTGGRFGGPKPPDPTDPNYEERMEDWRTRREATVGNFSAIKQITRALGSLGTSYGGYQQQFATVGTQAMGLYSNMAQRYQQNALQAMYASPEGMLKTSGDILFAGKGTGFLGQTGIRRAEAIAMEQFKAQREADKMGLIPGVSGIGAGAVGVGAALATFLSGGTALPVLALGGAGLAGMGAGALDVSKNRYFRSEYGDLLPGGEKLQGVANLEYRNMMSQSIEQLREQDVKAQTFRVEGLKGMDAYMESYWRNIQVAGSRAINPLSFGGGNDLGQINLEVQETMNKQTFREPELYGSTGFYKGYTPKTREILSGLYSGMQNTLKNKELSGAQRAKANQYLGAAKELLFYSPGDIKLSSDDFDIIEGALKSKSKIGADDLQNVATLKKRLEKRNYDQQTLREDTARGVAYNEAIINSVLRSKESYMNTWWGQRGLGVEEYTSGAAQATNVLGMNLGRNRGERAYRSAFDLSIAGMGSTSTILGNLGTLAGITGFRGENRPTAELEKIMTKAVAAGFDNSRTGQKFFQTTAQLVSGLGLGDMTGTAVRLSRLMTGMGGSEADLAMLAKGAMNEKNIFNNQAVSAVGDVSFFASGQFRSPMARTLYFTGKDPAKNRATVDAIRRVSGASEGMNSVEDVYKWISENPDMPQEAKSLILDTAYRSDSLQAFRGGLSGYEGGLSDRFNVATSFVKSLMGAENYGKVRTSVQSEIARFQEMRQQGVGQADLRAQATKIRASLEGVSDQYQRLKGVGPEEALYSVSMAMGVGEQDYGAYASLAGMKGRGLNELKESAGLRAARKTAQHGLIRSITGDLQGASLMDDIAGKIPGARNLREILSGTGAEGNIQDGMFKYFTEGGNQQLDVKRVQDILKKGSDSNDPKAQELLNFLKENSRLTLSLHQMIETQYSGDIQRVRVTNMQDIIPPLSAVLQAEDGSTVDSVRFGTR